MDEEAEAKVEAKAKAEAEVEAEAEAKAEENESGHGCRSKGESPNCVMPVTYVRIFSDSYMDKCVSFI